MQTYKDDLNIAKNLLGYLFGDNLGAIWYEHTILHESEELYDMMDRCFGFDLPDGFEISTDDWRAINRSCMDYFGINRYDDSTAGKAYLDYAIGRRKRYDGETEYYFEIQHRMDI